MEEEFLRQQDILNPDAIIYEKLSGGEGVFNLEEILEKYRKYLEQRSGAGQVDAVVMLRKSLVDEIERFDEVLEDEYSTLYRGMRSGLQKALDLLDMRTAT